MTVSRWRPAAVDTVITAVLAAVVFVATVGLDYFHPSSERGLDPLGYALLGLAVLPLLWRRRAPLPVAFTTVPATTLYYPLGYPDGPVLVCGAVALFTLVAQGYRWQGWSLGLVQWLAVHGWESVRYGSPLLLGPALGVLAWTLVIMCTAEVVRWRREYQAVEEQRRADAARSREEEILRRAADERLRLARDVHDTVAHSISLINVQAGTALYLMEAEPERAAQALATIKRASKETLRDLRATLAVLRSVDEEAPRSPTPGLDRLERLVEDTRGAGIGVTLEVCGTRRRLPSGTEAAAFRITQEALTNVVRHSGARRAVVEVAYRPDALELRVHDDGHGPAPGHRPGNGLTGMRERAEALGGAFGAGPGAERGFAVWARLPAFPDRPAEDTGDTGPDGVGGGGERE
ncbi:sensor histidine kinase [Nocardiopsis sp. RSe5-2]|uniref:histidine kinase n=1 Tax=Nocardiopsis endophytica TaxID=3018445 RepID=A0ABT4U2C7_9ACTN|nr:sensor histidine kinase [Nocardiopsis endophytica]MDA2811090.1 sensor histidine kinase [Nocardiopsis endophytica]